MERTRGLSMGDRRYRELLDGRKRVRRSNLGRFGPGARIKDRFVSAIAGTSSGKRAATSTCVGGKSYYIVMRKKAREAEGNLGDPTFSPTFSADDQKKADEIAAKLDLGINLMCGVNEANSDGLSIDSFLDEHASLKDFRRTMGYCFGGVVLDDVSKISFEACFMSTLNEALDQDDQWDARFAAATTLTENAALIQELDNKILAYRLERVACVAPIPANIDKAEKTSQALGK